MVTCGLEGCIASIFEVKLTSEDGGVMATIYKSAWHHNPEDHKPHFSAIKTTEFQ
jgi:hypothetical protein